MAAAHAFNVEAFALLGVALAITGLRLYVRISSVGFKGLWADDYLVVMAAVSCPSFPVRPLPEHRQLTVYPRFCTRQRQHWPTVWATMPKA